MVNCPSFYAFTSEGNLHGVRCGQWACSTCAKHLARLWAWRCRLQVEQAGRDYFFWTLTLSPKVTSATRGYELLPSLWDNLRKKVQRVADGWDYCAFVEGQTKRGNMPHFHVLSSYASPGRLKDVAVSCGFGFEAKQSVVTSQRAANYCAKYASKTNPVTPKGFRRVRCSRNWAKLPPFEGDPLIVRGKRELLSDYLLRVHWVTGVPMDDLLYVWANQLYVDKVTNIDTSLRKYVV